MNYTLKGQTYTFTADEQALIDGAPKDNPKEWYKGKYNTLKQNIKRDYLLKQSDRCGYCRVFVEPDGLYEPVEHIVAKSVKPLWMFEPRNLAVACNPCNNLKNDTEIFSEDHVDTDDYPDDSDDFTIFHPHFDAWNDHLELEDNLFIRAKDLKGENTIRAYKLSRFQIPVKFAREARLAADDSASRIAVKLTRIHEGTDEYNNLKAALKYLEDRV